MVPTTASVSDPQSIDFGNAALIVEIQDDLNALALKLAQSFTMPDPWDPASGRRCLRCERVWDIRPADGWHTDQCLVGNILKLTARLGELRDQAAQRRAMTVPVRDGDTPERHIEYISHWGGIAGLLDPEPLPPAERVTHEEAALRSPLAMAVNA